MVSERGKEGHRGKIALWGTRGVPNLDDGFCVKLMLLQVLANGVLIHSRML